MPKQEQKQKATTRTSQIKALSVTKIFFEHVEQ